MKYEIIDKLHKDNKYLYYLRKIHIGIKILIEVIIIMISLLKK